MDINDEDVRCGWSDDVLDRNREKSLSVMFLNADDNEGVGGRCVWCWFESPFMGFNIVFVVAVEAAGNKTGAARNVGAGGGGNAITGVIWYHAFEEQV
ncbi:hypothetical protein V6N13_000549 [Hibiscus sabdariffa]